MSCTRVADEKSLSHYDDSQQMCIRDSNCESVMWCYEAVSYTHLDVYKRQVLDVDQQKLENTFKLYWDARNMMTTSPHIAIGMTTVVCVGW